MFFFRNYYREIFEFSKNRKVLIVYTKLIQKSLALAMAVDVSGEKFVVIGCSLLLIRMIQEYLGCLSRLPEPSLLHKLADLLSLFNSRCCQLVLGGGATTTLGLRSITIKHLALTGFDRPFHAALL